MTEQLSSGVVLWESLDVLERPTSIEDRALQSVEEEDAPDNADAVSINDPDKEARMTKQANDPVFAYLDRIGKYPLLTAEEEVELAKDIEAGLFAEHLLETTTAREAKKQLGWLTTLRDLRTVAETGKEAKKTYINANLRLVVSIASRYSQDKLSLLDLIQEGNLGLMRAVEKFDYQKGYKFSTYATWWIRQAINHAIHDGDPIRVPVHVNEDISKMVKTERAMSQAAGRSPSDEELANELGWTTEKLANHKQYYKISRPDSLNRPISREADSPEMGDFLQDPGEPFEDNAELRADAAPIIDSLSLHLTPEEKVAFSLRYLSPTEPSFATIGQIMGCTRERARYVTNIALAKLKDAHNANPDNLAEEAVS